MSTMTFGSFIQINAKKHPDRTALVHEGKILTYGDLHIRSNRLANALRKKGVRKGDKVSLYMTNCLEYIETIVALAKIGAPFVPIGYRLVSGEMKYIVDNSESVALFFSGDLMDQVLPVRKALEGVSPDRFVLVGGETCAETVAYEDLLRSGETEEPEVDVGEEDDFYLGYTAGTTGFPKGALFTHRARVTALVQLALEFGIGQEDKTLISGPLYHTAPCFFSFIHLFLGGQVVLMKQFDPLEALESIQSHGVTNMFMVPTQYNMILNLPAEEKKAYDMSSVRVLSSAAAPLPTRIKEQIMEFFPNAGFNEFYGFTEGGLVSNLRPEDQLRKTRCVGLPMVLADYRILDDDGNELPPGEEGLIYIRCPCVMKEFYKNPEATRSAFRGDWVTAHDIGKIDEEGYLYLVDRKADMVISGGVNIYPTEIEEVLHKHPKVQEAAVIGIPDEKWGESLLAFVVKRAETELGAEEIISFCEGKIARYKIPRSIKMVTDLPKSPVGKVLKRVLREPFWKDHEGRI